MLGVIQTFSGPCAIGRGTCRVCGWTGVDAFDVGLQQLSADGTEWAYDESASPPCPNCTLQELDVDLDVESLSAGRDGSPAPEA